MQTMFKTIKPFAYVMLLGASLLFSACNTTTSSGADFNAKKDPKKAVELRTQIAAEYIRMNKLDLAKQELDAALKIDPRSVEANGMMGVLLQAEGSPINLAKADDFFRRALSSDKADPQLRNNYGSYLFKLGRYSEAVEHFNIAATTLGYTKRFISFENLGRAYLKMGDKARAKSAFLQALEINPYTGGAKIHLAEMAYEQRDFAQASKLYEEYVRQVGQQNQGVQGLWVGIRVARANGDDMGMKVLSNQLRAQFPDSAEYKRFLELQNSKEAVWK